MKIAIRLALAGILSILVASQVRADEVILKNGDKLTGKVGQITAGTMSFKSSILGSLTIKLSDIDTYKTETPATVELNSGQSYSSLIVKGTTTQITTADKQTTPITVVKSVNPPDAKWTGSVVLNGALNRGNVNTTTVGMSANAILRRDTPVYDDRFTLGADYNYGNTGLGKHTVTTTDSYDALFKYDKFFTEKLYGYGDVGYLRDRISGINIELTPGAGVGYQWIEQPNLNFNTEGGVSYVYEELEGTGVVQQPDFRLAYHVDAKFNPIVSVFHDVEYLAAFNDPANYLINADAGIRADLTANFFSQFKVVYHRNDRPAMGLEKDDLQYLLGVGWAF